MLDLVRRFFDASEVSADNSGAASVHDVRVATCAILLEMANVDGEFDKKERQRILTIMQRKFEVSKEAAEQLEQAAQEEIKNSIDLWQFTNLINENYSDEEKSEIIELIWAVVYADGKLDAHEDYLIHKLASLLNIEHRQLMNAKLTALNNRR